MKRAVLVLIGITFTLCAFSQAQKNLNLLSQMSLNADLNDVWGYVAPDGTEYALIGRFDGVSIVSLNDPVNPVEVADIPGQGSIWRDLKTYGEYAYVSHDDQPNDTLTGNGTLIIDLTDLPNSVRYKDTLLAGVRYAHNVYIDDAVLYVIGPDNFNGGIVMFDLADPWEPAYLGAYTEHYVHDAYVRDNKAYTGEIYEGQLSVVDVTNKANPTRLGSVTYPGGFTHNTWLNDAGNVCFTTDELDRAYLIAWDVSDPTSMYPIDRIRSSLSNGRATPHNIHVQDDYMITSYYKDGVNIVDASRPHNLIEVGYYDTSPMEGGGTDGCWGAYPFLPSGLVLATDIQEGLFVFRPNYTRAAYLEGTVTDASNNNPINRAEITISQPLGIQEFTSTFGNYATGSAEDVDVTVTFAKYGYRPEIQQASLRQGILTQMDVILQPAQLVNLQVEVYNAHSGQTIPDAEVLLVAPGDEQTFDYTTDVNGDLTLTNFLEGKYDLIAGKWGYVTNMLEIVIEQNTPVIKIGLFPGYYDDFAFDFSWTVSGDARRGEWERGEPIGSIMYDDYLISPELDLQDDFGPFCYVTENGSGEFFEHDVDDGATILTSPVMDLSKQSDPVLEFSWWLFNFDANSLRGGNDYLRVEASDDGATWIQVFESTSVWRNSWRDEAAIHFSDFFASYSSTMQVRFVTGDDEPGNIVEAAIDRFFVYDQATVSNDIIPTQKDISLVHGDGFIELLFGETLDRADFQVIDLGGRTLSTGQLSTERERISTALLAPGVYVISLISQEGERTSLKFFAN